MATVATQSGRVGAQCVCLHQRICPCGLCRRRRQNVVQLATSSRSLLLEPRPHCVDVGSPQAPNIYADSVPALLACFGGWLLVLSDVPPAMEGPTSKNRTKRHRGRSRHTGEPMHAVPDTSQRSYVAPAQGLRYCAVLQPGVQHEACAHRR